MAANFYVYAYLRENLTPYYIGKGSGKRAWTKGTGEIKPPKDRSKMTRYHFNNCKLGGT